MIFLPILLIPGIRKRLRPKTMNKNFVLTLLLCLYVPSTHAGDVNFSDENRQLKYSDMNSWWTREVKESGLIGGNTVLYAEPGPSDENFQKLDTPIPHLTPWASSNVKAHVKGITTGNEAVFYEERKGGYCARLETRLKSVVVLGIVNVKAIASGSIFTGSMLDPITDPDNPRHNTYMGVPFSEAPSALEFDYKTQIGEKREHATGGLRVRNADGPDKAEAYILLQNRTEDDDGNLIVKRVGTGWVRFEKSTKAWVNNYQVPIHYGDITNYPNFEEHMNLISHSDPYYALNSKNEVKEYAESGWSDRKDTITHIIIVFSSSYEGNKFIGSTDSKLWIDNINLKYDI